MVWAQTEWCLVLETLVQCGRWTVRSWWRNNSEHPHAGSNVLLEARYKRDARALKTGGITDWTVAAHTPRYASPVKMAKKRKAKDMVAVVETNAMM